MTETAPIVQFTVEPAVVQPGGCATFRWRVEGVKEVYFFAEGEGWRGHGVVGAGEQRVCPAETTIYRLRVVRRDDTIDVHKLTVQVQAQAEPAVVQMFEVDRSEIGPGDTVTFRWRVEGVKAVYFHAEGKPWQDKGVAGVGEAQRSPQKTTTFCLRVVKRDDALEIHCLTVKVKA